MSSYSWCLHDLRVQCLKLYTSCNLSQYHWDKACHFPWKFNFFVKTIADLLRFWIVYLNLASAQYSERGHVLEIYLQCAAHITTIHDLFIYFIFKFFFTRSPILRAPFLHPGFPVNLEVLLMIAIVPFFDHSSNELFQSDQRFQAIEFVVWPVSEKLDMGFLFRCRT